MAVIHLIRDLLNNALSSAGPTATEHSIPLWALIVIAIGGTVILVIAIVFPLIFWQRWRRQRRRQGGYRKRAMVVDGREISVYRGGGDTSTETLERPGKLRKRIRAERDNKHGGDGSDSEEENGLGSYLSLPPVLPMIRRASSGLFSVNSSKKSLIRRQSDGEMMSGAVVLVHRPGSGHPRRTSNAWVDEDALHGPEINVSPRKSKKGKVKDRGRRSWRRSIRESWPLKSLSPTLPKIASFSSFGSPRLSGGEGHQQQKQHQQQQQNGTRPILHDAPSTFRFQHHLAAVPRLSIPATEQRDHPQPQYSPPRQLPKPPRQALLAANDEAAGTPRSMSPASIGRFPPRDRGLSYYIYEDTGDRATVPAPLRLSTGKGAAAAATRLPSSESTLTHILSTTDKRLAEGGGTRRSRGSLGASAMGGERSGTLGTPTTGVGGASSTTLVGSSTASHSPSPLKLNFHKHGRVDSQDSVLSEDSLFGLPVVDPSPGSGLGYFHGLSSPNRGSPPRQQQHHQQQQQQARQVMPMDSPDSALSLSTCPEVDETAIDEETPAKQVSGSKAADNVKGQENDDPFVVLRNSPALAAERRLQPVSRAPGAPGHAFSDPPRLYSAPGPGPLISRNEITLSFLRSDSPLSTISGNSRSPELRPRRSPETQSTGKLQTVQKPQTPRGGGQQPIGVHMTAPTSAVSSSTSSSSQLHRRNLSTVADDEEEDEVGSLPGISLTSASPKDKNSPTVKRLTDLRGQPSSPTLGRNNREQTPDMPPPRPAMPRDSASIRPPSSYYDTFDGNETASLTSSTHRRAAGEVMGALRKPSNNTTTSSSQYTEFEREKLDALSDFDLDNSQQQQQQRRRRSQTIRLVPPEHARLPVVSTTIAQLRRMNSQVSAYSNAASGHSDDGSSASPVLLPTLREEETGRFVSPPRKREASRNYLSVGNVPVGYTGGGGGGGDVNDKENQRKDANNKGLKVSRVGTGALTPDSHTKRFLRAERSPERGSPDSLGLYDADGFWISPERRRK